MLFSSLADRRGGKNAQVTEIASNIQTTALRNGSFSIPQKLIYIIIAKEVDSS
jgi:hypothetical protein